MEFGLSTQRQRHSGVSRHVWPVAITLVVGAHVGVLGFMMPHPELPERVGAAPVINLSLEPVARFNSPTPPARQESAAASAGQNRADARSSSINQTSLSPTEPVDRPQVRQSAPAPAGTGAPQPVMVAAAGAGPSGSTGTGAVDSRSGATQGGGGSTLGASAAPRTDRYAAQVLAWIERNKRHPGGERGVVTVRFELDRTGRVHGLTLARSSGQRHLDRSALDQIARAQPFPRPDADVEWVRYPFTVNIDYRLTAQRAS